jgi:hypothetical protein
VENNCGDVVEKKLYVGKPVFFHSAYPSKFTG